MCAAPKRQPYGQALDQACSDALAIYPFELVGLSASSKQDAYLFEALEVDRCSYLCCSECCRGWGVCGINARKKLWVWEPKPEVAFEVFISHFLLFNPVSPEPLRNSWPFLCYTGMGAEPFFQQPLPTMGHTHPRRSWGRKMVHGHMKSER